MSANVRDCPWFYHSEKLQSTKTDTERSNKMGLFYHSEKLQSTKTTVTNCHLTI